MMEDSIFSYHSGYSFGITMRNMEYIAKNGYEKFQNMFMNSFIESTIVPLNIEDDIGSNDEYIEEDNNVTNNIIHNDIENIIDNNKYTINKYDIDKENNIEYIHFEEIDECKMFINFIKKHNIINNVCCGGYGCGIFKNICSDIDIILNDFYLNLKKKELYKECCVCYSNTIRKTLCNHILCKKCYQEIQKKECPYCRQKI
jgi:hypothetical protein